MAKKVIKTKSGASKPLTDEQAKFVEYVLKGDNYVDAYVKAYKVDVNTRSEKSIRTSANTIRSRQNVTKALREGEAIVNIHNVVWTKEKSLNKLTELMATAEQDIMEKGLNKTNADLMMGIIRELNSVAGTYYRDQKKYETDLKKVEIEHLRYELEKTKVSYVIEGPKVDETTDDNFLEALENAANNVWEVVPNETKPE